VTRRARIAAFLVAGALVSEACRRAEVPAGRSNRAPAANVPPVEAADAASRARKPTGPVRPVFWLGLDGLDWQLLDRLSSEGKMPNWKRLTEEGWSASLASFLPLLSPILWTTAATGVGPEVHRVLDFQEVDPKTGRKEPISGRSRAVPAVWNIASASERSVGVVGWWATHPAEEVRGFFVTDHATPLLFDRPTLSGTAYPASLQAGITRTVESDGRIEGRDLAPYLSLSDSEITSALASPPGPENRIGLLARVLAATRVSQRLARELYDRNRPDLLVLYLAGTDEVGHLFAPFTPPRLRCPSVTDADFARYSRVVETYYQAVDRILGQWMRRAEEDGATLLVHSDHGFKWGEDRPCALASGDWTTAAFWHREDGVLAVWGRGVRHSTERSRASLFQVAPTVLSLLGLPADRLMPKTRLEEPFLEPRQLEKADQFARVTVHRVAAAGIPTEQSSEYARKLLALGYLSPADTAPLSPTGGDQPGMTEGAWNNLGVYLRDTAKDLPAARQAFEKSLALRPGYYSPLFNLALLHRMLRQTRQAEDFLFRSLAALKTEPDTAVVSWSRQYQRSGDLPAARSLLDRASRLYPGSEGVARELARLRYRAKDCRGALAALSRFEAASRQPQTFNDLALFQACLGSRAEVVRLLERSLALDPNQSEVAQALGRARER
jgi:predicted AlkP superfamily phosphohydrolase/phosphomutase